jgi:hypothetical protein
MKYANDARAVAKAAAAQRGVFSKADLQTLLAEPHTAGFARRFRALEDNGVLRRFCRGFYVAESFDLPTLSQRIAPGSYVSLETVLARELLVGPRSERRVVAVKTGKQRSYEGLGYEVVHLQVAPHLVFGYSVADGVRFADAEKGALDTLYFHQRGRRYPFDIYTDITFEKLDRTRLESYLRRYRNPKFVTFARRLLELT